MTTFYKYHGLGNDFIVVSMDVEPELSTRHVERWCDRHRGIGADGILVLTPTDAPACNVQMVVYNRDGSRPETCGNGIRCAARHWIERLASADDVREVCIETDAGPQRCRIRSTDPWQIGVDMGRAEVAETPARVETPDGSRSLWPVDMGNPHGVCFESLSDEALEQLGRRLNDVRPAPFGDGVNVECVDDTQGDRLRARVYERGVGPTAACGTGACAVAIAARATERVEAEVATVTLPGGNLEVAEHEDGVWLGGPAEAVFRGETQGIDSL